MSAIDQLLKTTEFLRVSDNNDTNDGNDTNDLSVIEIPNQSIIRRVTEEILCPGINDKTSKYLTAEFKWSWAILFYLGLK